MKRLFVNVLPLALLLALYAAVVTPMAGYMRNRPTAIKVGFMPDAEALTLVAAPLRYLLAQVEVVRILFYYGTLLEDDPNLLTHRPDYRQMYNNLVETVKLDPRNADAYYFAQAAFTWQVGRVREVNRLLEYGLPYRPTDWQLPFWLGFNNAYFLHEYEVGARWFQKAAEVSGEPMFANLAARYMNEAGETGLAIAYLETLLAETRDPRLRQLYLLRRDALLAVREIEAAVTAYRQRHGIVPPSLAALVASGLLAALPADPYGGTFFLDATGRVRTTSKFARHSPSAEGGAGQRKVKRP